MKKFILPLLILLFVGSLFAVESDPSAVVGYVKYGCYSGFNFVAVPMGQATTAEALGEMYLPNVTTVAKWNPSTQSWSSVFYDADFEEWFGSVPVSVGDVVVMFSSSSFSFYSLGTPIASQTYSISNGYNHITVPLNRMDITSAESLGTSIGNVASVAVWSNQAQSWNTVIYDEDFDEWFGSASLSIGDIAVPYSTSSSVWPSRHSNSVQKTTNK
jgi:hypothetical protein